MPEVEVSADEAYNSLEGREFANAAIAVVINEPGSDEPRPYQVNLSGALRNIFELTAAEWIQQAADDAVVPYAPGRRPDLHELVTLPLAAVPVASVIVPQLEQPGAQQDFDLSEAKLSRLRLYAVSMKSSDGDWAHLTRKLTRGFQLSKARGITAAAFQTVYQEIPDQSVHFDTSFDTMIWRGHVFVRNQADFERSYDFADVPGEEVKAILRQALEHIPVSNLEDFLAVAHDDQRMHNKVRSVAERLQDPSYAEKLTVEKVRELVQQRDDVELTFVEVDGYPQIFFEDGPKTRWTILKVLDDDYLLSELTDLRYEANSKIRSG